MPSTLRALRGMEERNQPVAIRVVRPYDDENALLDAEVSVFSRTGIALIGAPSRPQGVVLRFEIALRDGSVMIRGEGRVVGYRAPTQQEEGALLLRFTRLDMKSKALLDRAVGLREERRGPSLAPPPPRASKPPSTPPDKPAEPVESAESVESAEPAEPPRSVPARPPTSVAPRMSLPSVAPTNVVAMPAPAPTGTTEEVDDADVEEVDEADLASADATDLTEQAPPVALTPEPPAVPEAAPSADPADVAVEPPLPPAPPPAIEVPVVVPPRIEAAADPDRAARLSKLARGRPFVTALDGSTRGAALDRLRARRG